MVDGGFPATAAARRRERAPRVSTVTLDAVRKQMREDLNRSGLKETDVYAEPSLTDIHGHAKPGYFLRYPDPSNGKPNGFHRYKYFPQLFQGFAKTAATGCPKYDQPAGEPHVYFPRSIRWAELIADASKPLFITEGEKKAAAGCKAGYPTLGLGGVWNWKVKEANEDVLIPDLATIAWKERPVFVICDSDAATNELVQQGANRFCIVLTDAGAKAHQVILPQQMAGEKIGLDDFLVAVGNAGFDGLIAAAEEWVHVLRSELLHTAVKKCERILAGRHGYKLFLHGSELVRVVEQDSDPEPVAAFRRPRGTAYLTAIREDNVEFLLSGAGRVFEIFTEKSAEKNTKAKKKPVATDPKWAWCRQVVANAHTFPEQVPWWRLQLVTHTPLLLENGDVVSTPGYHADTGVWFDPRGVEFPELSYKPTKEQARAALAKFANVYEKFPFAGTSEKQNWSQTSSYAAVLATIFGILLRHLLPTVPLLGVTAPEAGSGKTKIAESISVVSTGCLPSRIAYDNTEEFDKHLPVPLLAGDRVILIDNVDRKMVKSARLSLVLSTEAACRFRVLGETREQAVLNRSVFVTTGNQLAIAGDLPRRSLLVKLLPNIAQPEERRFEFDPVTRARQHFPQLVVAALTAARYYFQNDCPQPSYESDAALESGSFEKWNRVVRGLLVHLGFGDPLATQKEVRCENPMLQDDMSLLQALRKSFVDGEFSAANIKPLIGSDAFHMLTDERGNWDPQRAGFRLRVLRDRVLQCGAQTAPELLKLESAGHMHGVARYKVVEISTLRDKTEGGVGWAKSPLSKNRKKKEGQIIPRAKLAHPTPPGKGSE
jgi:hypothetical protein